MILKNTFVQGKMNKDIDERLIPNGQYIHAENISVSNTDGSDAGAIENIRGNEILTNLSLTNGKTIGAYQDSSNQKLYFFITSDSKDLIIEYDKGNSQTNILLESSKPNSVLNFSTDYLITGVVKIINGDFNRDLLLWTDDLNAPRKINIERAKTYGVDGFIEDDISLIKKPPRFAPSIEMTYTNINENDSFENNLEDKFLSFAYRYKYADGEYSVLSSFSDTAFVPKRFDLDYQTMENEGMVNSFNAVDITFNTGDERVTDIELVFKESESNTVYIVETFNKDNKTITDGWTNNSNQTYQFSNSKIYTALPEDELFRVYDNVPLKAKALDIIGSRIVFGNYVEGYDLKDISNNDIILDYDVSSTHVSLLYTPVNATLTLINDTNDTWIIDFTGFSLVKNSAFSIEVDIEQPESNARYTEIFDYILNKDYNNTSDLAQDITFINFINNVMTATFNNRSAVNETEPVDSQINTQVGFQLISYTTTTISIQAPYVVYDILDLTDPMNPIIIGTETRYWNYLPIDINKILPPLLSIKAEGINKSLKSNRSYEVGVIYLDEFGRTTTVLTDDTNAHFIDQFYSTQQNKLRVQINHNPPSWADRYKLVVKQNKGDYQTIYSNIFYEDGIFRWLKLEGANKDKVKEGDVLIVKADITGALEKPIKTRVLEVTIKEKNFLDNGNIEEESGLYMKIKPTNFSIDVQKDNIKTFQGSTGNRYPGRCHTRTPFGTIDNLNNFTPYELNAGSTVTIKINFRAYGSISYSASYDKTFRVNGNYNSVKEWFDIEVMSIGGVKNDNFSDNYTWNGYDNIGNNICGYVYKNNNVYTTDVPILGIGDNFTPLHPDHKISGWGFVDDINACERSDTNYTNAEGRYFYIVPHRKGTASRSIYSDVTFTIRFAGETPIFETEGEDLNDNIFYETGETFEINNNFHQGNVQNQTLSQSAIVQLDFYNCYVLGNGAESYRYKDAFNTKKLTITTRPSSTSVEKYRQVRRYADLTYSEPYNENNNINGLNEFNLAKANYKEDIDKKYGFIQKIHSRDTDLIVFQEDKVSKVLFGKDLLLNADGTSNVSSIEDVLGQQVTYMGEYGISRNPESFSFDGYHIYFTDSKRGAVMRLSNNGLTEISQNGLSQYFKDLFRNSLDGKKFGGFDPYNDQYFLYSLDDNITISYDESVGGFTSFHSFQPDFLIGMNNEFYTFKNGDLYIHHSNNVNRNTYYGISYPSKVSIAVNEAPSDIKLLNAISLEGNYAWDMVIKSYISNVDDFVQSSINELEFVKKEGIWYAYARRNEEVLHEDSKSIYGIGTITNIVGNTLTINGYNNTLTVGDTLLKGDNLSVSGIITNATRTGNTTTLSLSSVVGFNVGNFVVGLKDARIEGGNLRGYVFRHDLEINKNNKVELFAINSKVIKSFGY